MPQIPLAFVFFEITKGYTPHPENTTSIFSFFLTFFSILFLSSLNLAEKYTFSIFNFNFTLFSLCIVSLLLLPANNFNFGVLNFPEYFFVFLNTDLKCLKFLRISFPIIFSFFDSFLGKSEKIMMLPTMSKDDGTRVSSFFVNFFPKISFNLFGIF